MKEFKLSHKILAFSLVIIFIFKSIEDINQSYTNLGISFCGPFQCDPTPLHLTYYCDSIHAKF